MRPRVFRSILKSGFSLRLMRAVMAFVVTGAVFMVGCFCGFGVLQNGHALMLASASRMACFSARDSCLRRASVVVVALRMAPLDGHGSVTRSVERPVRCAHSSKMRSRHGKYSGNMRAQRSGANGGSGLQVQSKCPVVSLSSIEQVMPHVILRMWVVIMVRWCCSWGSIVLSPRENHTRLWGCVLHTPY